MARSLHQIVVPWFGDLRASEGADSDGRGTGSKRLPDAIGKPNGGRRAAFTLVELIVAILILGILAAMAVPRLIGTTGAAADSALGRTLRVVRGAIETYNACNPGRLPGADGSESTFKNDLVPYLKGEFPACPVGTKDSRVTIADVGPDSVLTPDGSTGWMFNRRDGRFIANHRGLSSDGSRTFDQF